MTHVLDYRTAREGISDGDIGLVKRRSIISIAGRSEYSHAWMFRWWGDILMVLEFREWIGGRAVTARSQVMQRPNEAIDVYRPRLTRLSRDRAAEQMTKMIGQPYDYRGIWKAAALRLPPICLFTRPNTDEAADDKNIFQPHFCSAGVAVAYRPLTLVPNRAPSQVEPGDLATSGTLERLFTISKEGL